MPHTPSSKQRELLERYRRERQRAKPKSVRETQPGLEALKDLLRGVGGALGGGGATGAASSAITEALIQAGEVAIPGGEEKFNIPRIGAEAAVGAIPGAKLAKGAQAATRLARAIAAAKNMGRAARTGAAVGAAGRVAEAATEPDIEATSKDVVQSALFGAGGGALLSGAAKLLGRGAEFDQLAFIKRKQKAGLPLSAKETALLTAEAPPTLPEAAPEATLRRVSELGIREGGGKGKAYRGEPVTEFEVEGQPRTIKVQPETGPGRERIPIPGGEEEVLQEPRIKRILEAERRAKEKVEKTQFAARVKEDIERLKAGRKTKTIVSETRTTPIEGGTGRITKVFRPGKGGRTAPEKSPIARLEEALEQRRPERRVQEGVPPEGAERRAPLQIERVGHVVGEPFEREADVVQRILAKEQPVTPGPSPLAVKAAITGEQGRPRGGEEAAAELMKRLVARAPQPKGVEEALREGTELVEKPITKAQEALQVTRPEIGPIAKLARLATSLGRKEVATRLHKGVRDLEQAAKAEQALERLSPSERIEARLADVSARLQQSKDPDLVRRLVSDRNALELERLKAKRAELTERLSKPKPPLAQTPAELGGALVGGAYGLTTAEEGEDPLSRAALFAAYGTGAAFAARKGFEGISRVSEAVPATFQPSLREQTIQPIEREVQRIGRFPSLQKRGPFGAPPSLGTVRDVQFILQKHGASIPGGAQVHQPVLSNVSADLTNLAARFNYRPGKEEFDTISQAASKIHSDIFSPRGTKPSLFKAIQDGNATDPELLEFGMLFEEQKVLTSLLKGERFTAPFQTSQARTQAKNLDLIWRSHDTDLIKSALGTLGFRGDILRQARSIAKAGNLVDATSQDINPVTTTLLRDFAFSNMLSGIVTQERNIIGNASNAFFRLLRTPLASVWDPKAVANDEIAVQMVASWTGLQRGIEDALFSLKNGVNRLPFRTADIETVGRADTPRVEFTGGGANPFNWPGRGLQAADQFFRAIAFQQERYGAAFSNARAEGLSPQTAPFNKRVAELVTDKEMEESAWRAATTAVYQEEPEALARYLTKFKVDHPLFSFIVPFIRTPANIVLQGIQASPAGFLKTGIQRGAGRETALIQGGATAGTLALPLAWLAASGQITGNGPREPNARERWIRAGNRPYTIKIGDGPPIDYTLMQPISVPMMLIADAYEGWVEEGAKDDSDLVDKVSGLVTSMGDSLINQSYLRGVADLFEGIRDPKRFATRTGGGVASMFAPFAGLARDIHRFREPFLREQKEPEDVLRQSIIFPGFAEAAPIRRERLGEPAQLEGTPIQRGFLAGPLKLLGGVESLKPQVSPVEQLLGEVEPFMTEQLGRPSGELTVKGKKVPLDKYQKNLLAGAKGTLLRIRLERLMAQPNFVRLPVEMKAKAVEKVINSQRARTGAALRKPGVLNRLIEERRRLDIEAQRRAR